MNEQPNTHETREDLPFRVLVIEDEQLYAYAIARELERSGISCDVANTVHDSLALNERTQYEAVVLDHKLPDGDGLDLIPSLLSRQSKATVIMMTAYETIANAVLAIKLGAKDYLVKETSVRPIIDKVLEIKRLNDVSRGWPEPRAEGLCGNSRAILRVVEQLEKVARCRDTTVLLTGETGVGKEVAARLLHTLSTPESESRPFVAVDCIALPSTLAESVLFGHERGAFTGADRTREGAFHDAQDGTILLDEVGDIDPGVQGKLLRVLESRRYQRVGSTRERPFAARVVAATNRALAEMVADGTFRLDLYQRLAIFPIHIPPLRERGDDVLLLAAHFLEKIAQRAGFDSSPLSPEVRARLCEYDYPGNVRELKNIIERAVILAEGGFIAPHHLPERMLRHAPHPGGPSRKRAGIPIEFVPGVDSLETLEAQMLKRALESAGGVKTEAARILGISRFQLLRRLEKYGLRESER